MAILLHIQKMGEDLEWKRGITSMILDKETEVYAKLVVESTSVPTSELVHAFKVRPCREWSEATGLVNFRARWYDPVTGRWLSKDPIGLNGGLNLYAFCEGDPVEMSGLISVGEFMVH